jgi:hypothetical protein
MRLNMAQKPSSQPMAGGFFLALGPIGGGVLGMALGAPSQGLAIGSALGVVAAIAVFAIDWYRRRA